MILPGAPLLQQKAPEPVEYEDRHGAVQSTLFMRPQLLHAAHVAIRRVDEHDPLFRVPSFKLTRRHLHAGAEEHRVREQRQETTP